MRLIAYNKKHRRCLLVTRTSCGGNPTVATIKTKLKKMKGNPSRTKPSGSDRRLTSFPRFGKPKGAANRRAARKAICEKSFDFLNFAAYNKKHRRCLLVTSTPCGGNPTVATNIQLLKRSEDEPQTVSRLLVTDGLLLFIPKHIENLNENPENRNEPENFLKYMYHLPRFNPRE